MSGGDMARWGIEENERRMATERHRITFYGASDDLVEIRKGLNWSEEHNLGPWGTDVTNPEMCWNVTAISDEQVIVGVRVRAIYDGVWSFSVGPCFFGDNYDEPQPFPDWPIRFRTGEPAPAYSIVLEIDAPEFTTITQAVS